jgi:hypothetical protein
MIYRCPLCKSEFKAEDGGNFVCPSCHEKVHVGASGGTAIDLESRGKWLDAGYALVKMSILDPVGHFERVGGGSGWLRPWLFALVISAIVFMIAAAYQLGFQMLAASIEVAADYANPLAMLTVPFSAVFLVSFAIIGVPVGTTIALILQAAIYHVCLMMLGAAKRSLVDTFRVVCYSVGPQLFQIVPILGGLVAWVWQIVLTVIGMKVVHRTSYGRSSIAVLLPMLLCCGTILIIGIAIAGWIFAAALAAAGK